MVNVLAISGSPRPNSNSESIVQHILKGVISLDGDAKIEVISTRGKDIRPCVACDSCQKKVGCVLKDDMQTMYAKFDQADLLIVASPIYFNSVTAQLKALIDRTQAIWASKYILHQPLIDREKKRLGVFVATAGNPTGIAEFTPAAKVMELFFKAVNTQYFENFYVANIDKEPVETRLDVLTQAYQLGRQLLTEYLKIKEG